MAIVNVCVKVRKGRTDVWEKDWILHQPGLGDHQGDPRRARGLRNPKARETGPRHTVYRRIPQEQTVVTTSQN